MSELSDRELELAALHILAPMLNHGPSALSFELNLHDASEAALNRQRDKIAEYRQRVAAMSDKRVRRAYNHWLDFYQRENDEAREEMETGICRQAWLRREERRNGENVAIETNAALIPKP